MCVWCRLDGDSSMPLGVNKCLWSSGVSRVVEPKVSLHRATAVKRRKHSSLVRHSHRLCIREGTFQFWAAKVAFVKCYLMIRLKSNIILNFRILPILRARILLGWRWRQSSLVNSGKTSPAVCIKPPVLMGEVATNTTNRKSLANQCSQSKATSSYRRLVRKEHNSSFSFPRTTSNFTKIFFLIKEGPQEMKSWFGEITKNTILHDLKTTETAIMNGTGRGLGWFTHIYANFKFSGSNHVIDQTTASTG